MENAATVAHAIAPARAKTRSFPGASLWPPPVLPRTGGRSKKRASTPNVWVKAKFIWYPNSMFSYCLRLKTSSGIETKRARVHGPTVRSLVLPAPVSAKAKKRTTSVVSKQTSIRYISTTLSYSVRRPSTSSTPSGKSILCSLCGAQRSDRLSVPECHSSKIRTIDHASEKTTFTPNART